MPNNCIYVKGKKGNDLSETDRLFESYFQITSMLLDYLYSSLSFQSCLETTLWDFGGQRKN